MVKGPVYSKELIIRDTGSITGSIEADDVEIHGHLDGKVSAQNIVIGATGTVKGDIEFGNNLRTENGADIDGYIKKTNTSKSKLTGDFLFKKKDKKETSETDERPEAVNKEADSLIYRTTNFQKHCNIISIWKIINASQ